MVAFWRACESRSPKALIQDPFAIELADRFLSQEKRQQYSRSPIFQTTVDILAIRTRLIDDRLLGWSHDHDGLQVVNLGVGLDARPYRLPFPSATRIFQVDTEAVTRWNESFFAQHQPNCAVIPVAADLNDVPGCLAHLAPHGLDPDSPVVWVLEGLLEFLDRETVPELLAAITSGSPSGSRLIVQVLDPSLIRFARDQGDGNFPLRRLDSLETVMGYLDGWRVAVISCDEMNARFDRGMENLFHLLEGRC